MRSLNEAIGDGVRAWAAEFAEANGLTDVTMFWGVSSVKGRVWGTPQDTSSPSVASAAVARWAVALDLINRPPSSHVYVGEVIYEGFVNDWNVRISAMVDQAANNRARMEYEAQRAA
jgi:hypothetical protein